MNNYYWIIHRHFWTGTRHSISDKFGIIPSSLTSVSIKTIVQNVRLEITFRKLVNVMQHVGGRHYQIDTIQIQRNEERHWYWATLTFSIFCWYPNGILVSWRIDHTWRQRRSGCGGRRCSVHLHVIVWDELAACMVALNDSTVICRPSWWGKNKTEIEFVLSTYHISHCFTFKSSYLSLKSIIKHFIIDY